MTIKRYLLWIWCKLPDSLFFKSKIRKYITYLISYKFQVGVLGLVLNNEGKLLLFKHSYFEGYKWGLPGGGAKHENLRTALEREISEESSFVVKADRLIAIVRESKRGLSFVFSCTFLQGNFQNKDGEVEAYGFFALDEFPAITVAHEIILRVLMQTEDEERSVPRDFRGYIDLSEHYSLIPPRQAQAN